MKTNLTHVMLLFIAFGLICSCKPDPDLVTTHNGAPIADAGNNQIITPFIDSVVLDGSLSSDPDANTKLNYSWRIIKSTPGTIIRKPNQARTIAAQISPGYHEFELIVTDQLGLGGRDTVSFFVGNAYPLIMSAGPDTMISLPYDRVYLSGSVEDHQSFESATWRLIGGPTQANVLIKYPLNLETPAIDLTAPGTYKFELSVKNRFGTIAKDTVTVSALPDNNTYTRELIFNNLSWSCPWGCVGTVSLTAVPPGNPFLVYIKTPPSTQFKLVGQAIHPTSELLYDDIYWYDNGQLTVLTYDENLKIEIKVRY